MSYVSPRKASETLGLDRITLRKLPSQIALPDGAILRTPGGHHRYDIELIKRALKVKAAKKK